MRKPLSIPVRVESVAATPHPTESLESKLRRLSAPLKTWSESEVRDRFQLPNQVLLIKTTLSLCPECLTHVHAAVVRDGEQVWMHKQCPNHGASRALIENDWRFYRVSSKDQWGRHYGQMPRQDIPTFNASSCCGPGEVCAPSGTRLAEPIDHTNQIGNKTCTVLMEVTDACNLACRVCYSDSKGDRIIAIEEFRRYLIDLAALQGRLDSVQITGGEASLHPQFWELLHWLYEQQDAVGKIYLPTNGLLFNKDDWVERLKPYRDRVLVLLQFDGRDQNTNPSLRKAKPERQREALINRLNSAGIAMQLTMTLSQDVSEADIAWVVQQGLKHKNVRLIAMQPAFYSGRYELPTDPNRRLTLSDCAKGVVAGMNGRAVLDDFLPIPCSHPNCGWVTLFARRFGLVRNIARHVDLNAVMNEVAYKTLLNRTEMQDMLGTRGSWFSRILARLGRKFIRPQDVFGIAIKPFMDRYTYDQDRISACCHHILDTKGQTWSFCEYNAFERVRDSWHERPEIAEHQASS